jgi:hypothetical protein
MLNPVIVAAVFVQVIVAKFSRMAGAVIGYLVTTGILLWGLSVYGQGGQIALVGIALSQPAFLIACLVWYGFDTFEFMVARKDTSAVKQAPVAEPGSTEEAIKAEENMRAVLEARVAQGLCPNCGSEARATRKNCPVCGVNLAWAQEHLDDLR